MGGEKHHRDRGEGGAPINALNAKRLINRGRGGDVALDL